MTDGKTSYDFIEREMDVVGVPVYHILSNQLLVDDTGMDVSYGFVHIINSKL